MKILMVNKFLYPNGGSETYMFKLSEQLKRMGHEVQFFGMESEERCVGNRVNAYTDNMNFHGGSKLSKLTYPLKTIYSSDARKKIRLVLDDFQPDAIHMNNFNFQLTPSIILEMDKWRRETGHSCKILYTAHDSQLVCPNHLMYHDNKVCQDCLGGHFSRCINKKCIHGSMFRSALGYAEATYWQHRKVYGLIDTIICCSHFMKKTLDTNPILADRTIAMHNFIDKVDVNSANEKQDYVLYFGRYSDEKGVRVLIEASKMLPNVQFVFAGRGPLEEEVNGVANIKNVGFQSGEALNKLIREARISVCPSICYENCPLAILESITHGTPVIGSNIGGIPELIIDGVDGLLFESGNAADLSKKISTLWNDRSKLDAYTKACHDVSFANAEEYAQSLMPYYGA